MLKHIRVDLRTERPNLDNVSRFRPSCPRSKNRLEVKKLDCSTFDVSTLDFLKIGFRKLEFFEKKKKTFRGQSPVLFFVKKKKHVLNFGTLFVVSPRRRRLRRRCAATPPPPAQPPSLRNIPP